MSTKRDTPPNAQRSKEIELTSSQNPKQAATQHIRWPKGDEIRWLENRLVDQEDSQTYQKGVVPEARDIRVWLARERDGLSWRQVAETVYGVKLPSSKALVTLKDEDRLKAAKSAARRAYRRVERYWNEGKTHLTGNQARMKRELQEWKGKNFTPGFFD